MHVVASAAGGLRRGEILYHRFFQKPCISGRRAGPRHGGVMLPVFISAGLMVTLLLWHEYRIGMQRASALWHAIDVRVRDSMDTWDAESHP